MSSVTWTNLLNNLATLVLFQLEQLVSCFFRVVQRKAFTFLSAGTLSQTKFSEYCVNLKVTDLATLCESTIMRHQLNEGRPYQLERGKGINMLRSSKNI